MDRIPRQTYLSLSSEIMESTRQYCTGKITLQFVGKNTDASVEKMKVFELDWKKHLYNNIYAAQFRHKITSRPELPNPLVRGHIAGLCGKVVSERHQLSEIMIRT